MENECVSLLFNTLYQPSCLSAEETSLPFLSFLSLGFSPEIQDSLHFRSGGYPIVYSLLLSRLQLENLTTDVHCS